MPRHVVDGGPLPFSPIRAAGDFVFLSGQGGFTPAGELAVVAHRPSLRLQRCRCGARRRPADAGVASILTNSIQSMQSSLYNGNDICDSLAAFKGQVADYTTGGKLTAAQQSS